MVVVLFTRSEADGARDRSLTRVWLFIGMLRRVCKLFVNDASAAQLRTQGHKTAGRSSWSVNHVRLNTDLGSSPVQYVLSSLSDPCCSKMVGSLARTEGSKTYGFPSTLVCNLTRDYLRSTVQRHVALNLWSDCELRMWPATKILDLSFDHASDNPTSQHNI